VAAKALATRDHVRDISGLSAPSNTIHLFQVPIGNLTWPPLTLSTFASIITAILTSLRDYSPSLAVRDLELVEDS
jgi:hypothetical protein